MINSKNHTVAAGFKSLFNQIETTLSHCISLENIIENGSLGDNAFELPDGGAIKFCDNNKGRGILVHIDKSTILLFKEDGNNCGKEDVVSVTYFNKELSSKKATLEDLLHIKVSIKTEIDVQESVEKFLSNNSVLFVIETKQETTVDSSEGVFTTEEMKQFIKGDTTSATEEPVQPTVEKVVEPTPTPEEPTMKEETKAAEPPKTTPKETPFYKKKEFWIGAGCAVGIGASVAWRIRSKLHSS